MFGIEERTEPIVQRTGAIEERMSAIGERTGGTGEKTAGIGAKTGETMALAVMARCVEADKAKVVDPADLADKVRGADKG